MPPLLPLGTFFTEPGKLPIRRHPRRHEPLKRSPQRRPPKGFCAPLFQRKAQTPDTLSQRSRRFRHIKVSDLGETSQNTSAMLPRNIAERDTRFRRDSPAPSALIRGNSTRTPDHVRGHNRRHGRNPPAPHRILPQRWKRIFSTHHHRIRGTSPDGPPVCAPDNQTFCRRFRTYIRRLARQSAFEGVTTISIKPYAQACSADMKLSRSVSLKIVSSGRPVCAANASFNVCLRR